jgi:L-2-hydroxyglutarate oxidase LhgO
MDAEITIIGAGVIGLAIAESLTESYKNVFLVEKHNTFGQETSSRNSEVIHAGIYYEKNSLKSKFCLEGKGLLYDYCKRYNIPYKNCGKLIVATTEEEISLIKNIADNASRNGLSDLIILEKQEIKELEPEINALKALFSPSTGIVDSHALMKQYEINTTNNGGRLAYGCEVTSIEKINKGYLITVIDSDKKNFSFTSEIVINSAGLTADKISEMAGIKDNNLKIYFCKGEYFRIKPPKNKLVSRLIYPVPHKNLEGVGIHITIDIAGGVKLGPDVTYLESNIYDYKLTPSKHSAFFESSKRYLPFLEYDDIFPEMAGIRPKIQKPGDPQKDFYIAEESKRGYPGFVNLIGMESPGLTSSIAIAKYVKGLVSSNLR